VTTELHHHPTASPASRGCTTPPPNLCSLARHSVPSTYRGSFSRVRSSQHVRCRRDFETAGKALVEHLDRLTVAIADQPFASFAKRAWISGRPPARTGADRTHASVGQPCRYHGKLPPAQPIVTPQHAGPPGGLIGGTRHNQSRLASMDRLQAMWSQRGHGKYFLICKAAHRHA
jgi:hypothetical protein